MQIIVQAKPGSKKGDLVTKCDDGSFQVHLKQRPIEGKANEALIAVIAEHFSVPKSAVTLVSGTRSKHKRLEIKIPA